MSELFLSHSLCYLTAIVMFTIALKLSYQSFPGKWYFRKNLVNMNQLLNGNDFGYDSEDHTENTKRFSICCNYIIVLGTTIFVVMYFIYEFDLFDKLPVNPLHY